MRRNEQAERIGGVWGGTTAQYWREETTERGCSTRGELGTELGYNCTLWYVQPITLAHLVEEEEPD